MLAGLPATAAASPRMISYNYPSCTSCHIHPMGAGILNDYGTVVDEAQSLRGELFDPESRPRFVRFAGEDFELIQDLRQFLQAGTLNDTFRFARTRFGSTVRQGPIRLYGEAVFDLEDGEKPDGGLDKGFAQLDVRSTDTGKTVLQAGEDYLPSGIGNGARRKILQLGDVEVFSAQSNLQLKLYDWSETHMFSGQLFAPSVSETAYSETEGGGVFYESYLEPNRVLGGSFSFFRLDEEAADGNLFSFSGHTRLGLGDKAFAALSEVTYVRGIGGGVDDEEQYSGAFQLFYNFREWLVPGLSVRALNDADDSANNEAKLSVDIYFRLSRNFNFDLAQDYNLDLGELDATVISISGKI